MSQVKSNQVIDSEVAKNPYVALPRDFVTTRELTAASQQSGLTDDSAPSEYITIPRSPAIISVINQSTSFKPDGTAVVDLILEIEDVGTYEYEIRVTKDAGNV